MEVAEWLVGWFACGAAFVRSVHRLGRKHASVTSVPRLPPYGQFKPTSPYNGAM
jgi:hypothetical protein